MKKPIVILFLMTALLPMAVSAAPVEIDGIWYNLNPEEKASRYSSAARFDCSRNGNGLSSEIPACFVVVELDAIGAAEVGQDLHDVSLLLGRELVFAVMITIVRAHACAEV
jgi:hypothetical protein